MKNSRLLVSHKTMKSSMQTYLLELRASLQEDLLKRQLELLFATLVLLSSQVLVELVVGEDRCL